jgi:hypothetical protein
MVRGVAGHIQLHTDAEAFEAEIKVLAHGALYAQRGTQILVTVVAVVQAFAAERETDKEQQRMFD